MRANSRSSASEDASEAAKKTAYRILSCRDHTTREMARKLGARGFSGPTISRVIEDLKQRRLIDDHRFVQSWSRFRIECDHFGPIRLRRELLSKGVSATEVEAQITVISREYDWVDQVEKALLSRYKDLSALKVTSPRRRAFDFLRRKGHQTDSILKVFRKKGLMTE